MQRVIVIMLAMTILSQPAYAEMYTWTDESGTFHATDNLEKAPDHIREKYLPKKSEIKKKAEVKKINFEDGYIETTETENSFRFAYYVKDEHSPTGYRADKGCYEEYEIHNKTDHRLTEICRESYRELIKKQRYQIISKTKNKQARHLDPQQNQNSTQTPEIDLPQHTEQHSDNTEPPQNESNTVELSSIDNLTIIIPVIVAFCVISVIYSRYLLLAFTVITGSAYIAYSIIGFIPLPLKIHLIIATALIILSEIWNFYKRQSMNEVQ